MFSSSSSSVASGKRRRTSMSSSASVASREDDAASATSDQDYQPEAKRKRTISVRRDPDDDPIEQCQQLYDIIRNFKKEDADGAPGGLLCEAFIRVPKRRQEPAYYEVVSNPMDMLRIQQKIKMDEYDDIEGIASDVELMVSNAKAFYKRGSQEHKDACDLWQVFLENKERLFDEDEEQDNQEDGGGGGGGERKGKIILKLGKLNARSRAAENRKSTSGMDDEAASETSSTTTDKQGDDHDNLLFDNLEELFTAVMVAKDGDDRPLHTVFQLLPSKRHYPNYYEIIDTPIDLKMIAGKIQGGEYGGLADLEKDLTAMFRNACTFNEPGSQIYKDAKALKRIVSGKRAEIENRKVATSVAGKTSERIRQRRLRGGLSHSAITAALQYEDDSEEEEGEEEDDEEDDVDEEEATQEEDEEMEVDEEGGEGEEEEEDGEGEGEEEEYGGDKEDPMWLLFEHMFNFGGGGDGGGVKMSEPFKSLPSRRYYPDYYKEIKQPIALSKIRAKLLRGEYDNLTQVQADMNVMFENAKTYNRPDSALYKTAVKLQRQMQTKAMELLDREVEGVSSGGEGDMGEPVKRNINSTPIPTLIMEGGGAAMEGFPQMNIPDKPPGLEIQAPAQGQVPQQVLQVHLQVPVVPVMSQAQVQQAPPPVFTKVVVPTVVSQATTSPKKVGGGGGSKGKGRESGGGGGGHGGLTISTKTNPHKGLSEREDPKAIVVREEIKKRLRLLYGTLVDYQQVDGRCPISLFMEKPSKKQYPDYYKVIVEPIDMLTIKQRIDGEGYNGTDELVKDFRLMFNNCRQYNEEGSLIYEDANKLEQVLNDKLRVIGPDPSVKPKKKKKRHPALLQKQKRLLETIKEFRDKNGRQLSTVFQKLPTKAEYPEYYEVIKSPIDLEKICNKQRNGTYESLDHIANDFMQMFDNACKFNEPDSQIYKDALILQRLLLQTKLTISSEDGIPDVACSVREILTSIFTSVYNHQDEEGRCYSDTMAELPEFDEVEGGQRKRAISLDLIKNRLDRGFYKRLDVFQKDMFLCFERARKNSRTDSQLFEDSIELHSFFIRTRDELTGKGEVLQSPALDYSLLDLEREVATLRAEKGGKESPHDEDLLGIDIKKEEGGVISIGGGAAGLSATGSPLQQMESYNDQVYCVGDFVYVSSSYNAEPSSGGGGDGGGGGGGGVSAAKPNIANIQKLWTAPDGTKMFDGIWFFRPDQTYHLPTRKFLQKEVFRSEVRSTAMLSEIVGKCWVMTVKGKEYFNLRPEGYRDEDVYVCEYRYASRARSFTKLKLWPFGSERVKLVQRQKVLEPVRVVSVFSERVANHKEELQKGVGGGDDEVEKMPPQQEFPNIRSPIPVQGMEDKQYYEQYNLPFGPVRMGDYVYVRVENGKKLVARIDSMWTDATQTAYFHGPWFTSISEVSMAGVPVGRTFYQQEIFQSSIEDTNPLLSICGKCAILDIDDYKKRRPTEIPEKDVFVCESLYDEARREICQFKGLKKIFCKDPFVHRDEVYFFRKLIPMVRVDVDGTIIHESTSTSKKSTFTKSITHSPSISTSSTFTPKMVGDPPDHSMDSMDFSPPSVGGSDSQMSQGMSMTPSSMSTPTPMVSTPIVTTPVVKKAKTPGKKLVTGYILYSSENRKSVAEKNPNKGFGEISRMVGTDWRKMPQEEKTKYEERAQKINQAKEAAAKEAQAEANAAAAAAAVAAAVSAAANGSNSNMGGDTSFQGAVISSGLASPAISVGGSTVATPGGGGKGKDGGGKEGVDMVTATQALKKDPDWIFECCWDGCDWQFEDALDLIEHCVQEPKGHVPEFFKDVKNPNEGEFQCHWKNCTRVKKGVNPFPTLSRLLKHVKDIHVMKGNGRIIHPDMRSKSIQLSRTTLANKAAAAAAAAAQGGSSVQDASVPSASGQQVQQATAQAPARPVAPAEPLFVAVPPRPQKLLHSEAYIRYIESLHAKKRKMTDWEKTLKATKENTKIPDETKVPRHWLGNGAGVHGSTTEALWALRDFMMRDALNLHKTS